MNTLNKTFLPVTLDECHARGWDAPDFVYVCGDAYVDHPSFGLAIISRILENAGYRVAMLCLPPWQDASAFKQFGKPRLGFLVSAGVIDSMVNHYTVAKKRRHDDAYAPGGKGFMRPDRATIVYCNRIRQAYRDVPILIGGVEASLRRFSHYDYWDDKVRHSILVDSGATLLMYGMGETSIIECANWVADGMNPAELPKMRGICYMSKTPDPTCVQLPSHQEVSTDKRKYAEAFVIQYDEQDPIRGKRMCQQQDTDRYLIQNQPCLPLSSVRPALHAHLSPDVQGGRRHPSAAGGRILDCLHARMLRLVQFLCHHVPSGAHHPEPQPRKHPPRRKAADTAAEFQGLHSRCRRSDGEFPQACVSKSAESRRVQASAVSVPAAVQELAG